jgi:hypothetical protein
MPANWTMPPFATVRTSAADAREGLLSDFEDEVILLSDPRALR